MPYGPPPLHAQPALTLRPSDARSTELFNRITGVRELASGTVLVVDARDARVAAVDFARGRTRTIGRTGAGPGEYRAPARLFALAGDSSLLTENGGRWFLMSGDSIVRTLPGDDAVITRAFSRMALGADMQGGVLALSPASAGRGTAGRTTTGRSAPSPFDSVPLVRIARPDGAMHTITILRPFMSRATAAPPEARASGPGQSAPRTYALASDGTDHVVGFCDGWTAVIRRDPFRVQWFSADGAPVASSAPQPLRPFTRADRAPFLRWVSAHTGHPPTDDTAAVATWPSHAPRLVGDADNTLALANGMLLVHEPSTATAPHNVARVYTRQARVHAQLTLPMSYRVVGSGPSGLYIAVQQRDGGERLQRHPAWAGAEQLLCGGVH